MAKAIKVIPLWFAAFVGATYLTGYLIEFFFYSSIGVFDVQNDALKLKYVQVGISFFLTFLIIGLVSFFFILGRARQNEDLAAAQLASRYTIESALPTLQVGIFLVSILCANLFTPTHFFHRDPERLPALAFLVALNVGAYSAGAWFIEWMNPLLGLTGDVLRQVRTRIANWRAVMAGAIISCSIFLDLYIFQNVWHAFADLIAHQGYFYILFVIAFFIVLYRMVTRMPERSSGFLVRASYLSTLGLYLPVLFYLSVWSYANTVFPFIPYSKGGADYTFAPHMNVIYGHAGRPEQHLDNVILIYDNVDALFVAHAWPSNDACNWRVRDSFPDIVQIPKVAILHAYVQALRPGTSNCNLPPVSTKRVVGPVRSSRP